MIDYPVFQAGSERERRAISAWLLAHPDRQLHYMLVGRLLWSHYAGRDHVGEGMVDLMLAPAEQWIPHEEPARAGFTEDPNKRQPRHDETGVLIRLHSYRQLSNMPSLAYNMSRFATRMHIGESSIQVPDLEGATCYEIVAETRASISAAARRDLSNWIMLKPDADLTRYPLLPRDLGVIALTKREMLTGES